METSYIEKKINTIQNVPVPELYVKYCENDVQQNTNNLQTL